MHRSVANPIRPDDYLSTRNYSNGLENESGSPMGREEAGALAEKRIGKLSGPAEHEDKPADSTPAAAPQSN